MLQVVDEAVLARGLLTAVEVEIAGREVVSCSSVAVGVLGVGQGWRLDYVVEGHGHVVNYIGGSEQ